jgi:hypothetical protein
MYRFILLFVLIISVIFASLSLAEIPKMINYQGMLTEESGDPLDGTPDITFRIYDAPSGGTMRWDETHYSVPVTDGLFNVILGSEIVGGVDLDFSEDYWLEIQVGNDTMPERLQFTSVGYAYRSMVADSAKVATPGSGSHWSVSDSVLRTNKLWGLGRGGAGNVFHGDSAYTHVNFGVACTTGKSGENRRCCTIGGGEQNSVGEDNTTIGGGVHNVIGGYDGYGATIGGGTYNYAHGAHVTIGGGHDNQSSAPSATIGGGWSNHVLWEYFGPTVAGGIENTAFDYCATVGGGHQNTAGGWGATVPGGERDSAVGDYSLAAGYRAKALHAGSFVWADSTDADFNSWLPNEFAVRASEGMRIKANSSDYGARLDNQSGGGDGLRAFANVSKGNPWGAVYAINYGTSPAIYAHSSGGLAAYFFGAVLIDDSLHVVGHLSKGSGAFKIDHPLDPENKYLYHSFVESPDMMNVYNGNVVLNGSGEARVDLPEWFEALNRDFRYQLTAIGQPGPNLYVAREISGNSFEIAGGEPGLKVSWQVTGIRQDRFAEKNRIPVEEEKPVEERGKYLHPKAYDLPESMGINSIDQKEKDR